MDMIIVLLLVFPADTAYQAREQGPFWRMIHPTLAAATDMALDRRSVLLLLWYIAPPAAAVVLRLLLLLLLQLLRGCDKNRDSRLGDYKMYEGSGAFYYKQDKK